MTFNLLYLATTSLSTLIELISKVFYLFLLKKIHKTTIWVYFFSMVWEIENSEEESRDEESPKSPQHKAQQRSSLDQPGSPGRSIYELPFVAQQNLLEDQPGNPGPTKETGEDSNSLGIRGFDQSGDDDYELEKDTADEGRNIEERVLSITEERVPQIMEERVPQIMEERVPQITEERVPPINNELIMECAAVYAEAFLNKYLVLKYGR